MSMTEYDFAGKAAWLRTKPDKWGKFTLCFYPKDAETRKAIRDLGLRNQINEDDGSKSGIEGLFYRFQTGGGPFDVVDGDGDAVTGMIGNGSEIVMTLQVERFESKDHGPQARSRVLQITVTNLIPFVPEAKEKTTEVPA